MKNSVKIGTAGTIQIQAIYFAANDLYKMFFTLNLLQILHDI